jgi:hypothetical protein
MESNILSILELFHPITLDEMSSIRLMNRTDTKFVTTVPMLIRLLRMARDNYYVQEIDGSRMAAYYTVYFDTADCAMYTAHETGHANRQKVRVRSYVDSHLNFLEVKMKNNHGRTRKKRVPVEHFDAGNPMPDDFSFQPFNDFLGRFLRYDSRLLTSQLENRFNRITLVNHGKTERLTIDVNLRFHHLKTDRRYLMDDIAIIELKRDGRVPSPILGMLRQLRIHPHGFSKYIIGSALTNDRLHCNRMKPKLRRILALRAAAVEKKPTGNRSEECRRPVADGGTVDA